MTRPQRRLVRRGRVVVSDWRNQLNLRSSDVVLRSPAAIRELRIKTSLDKRINFSNLRFIAGHEYLVHIIATAGTPRTCELNHREKASIGSHSSKTYMPPEPKISAALTRIVLLWYHSPFRATSQQGSVRKLRHSRKGPRPIAKANTVTATLKTSLLMNRPPKPFY
jgi:hypothetical protein